MQNRIAKYHKFLLGPEPTVEQMALYEAAPLKRGFAWPRWLTERQKEMLFEAVLMFALTQTAQERGEPSPHRVYLFVPAELEGWATEHIRRSATVVFGRCKKAQNVDLARLLGAMFKGLLLGGRLTPATQKPDRWAAFGFEAEDAVPRWLTEALLPVYPFDRDDEDVHL